MSYRKYGNKKTVVDGIEFDSKAEAIRYEELKLQEKLGMISDLELQPEFLLQEKFKAYGKTEREIKYIADFKYFDKSKRKFIVEDVKGFRTKDFNLKRKLFLYRYSEKYLFVLTKGGR